MKASFSVNMYDCEGDAWDYCILLHLEDKGQLIRFSDLHDLDEFIESVTKCREELTNAE